MRSFFIFLLLFTFSNIAFATRPFIIDNDGTIDDVLAILYFLSRNDIDIKAITIASSGEADCKPALNHIAGVIKLANKPAIPIACGRDTPLKGTHQFPQWVKEEANTMMGMGKNLPHVITQSVGSAPDILINKIKQSPEKMNILVLGPLTNIAEAIKKQPDIIHKIKRIYMMGGAIHVPGNIPFAEFNSKNLTAEWNIYIDPIAADIVFRSDIPLTLISLDATNQVPIDENFYKQLIARKHTTPLANFFYDIFMQNKKRFLTEHWYFWDTLAAVMATDQSFWEREKIKISIAQTPENLSGTTLIDKKMGKEIIVSKHVDAHRFNQVVLQTMMP